VTVAGEPRKDFAALDASMVLAEKLVVDPDWSTREGYDPDFLDISVPLPTLSSTMKANSVEVPTEFRVNGDKHVLAYHHYSLTMNRKRRFAWYSAANVDGKRRPALPERTDDEWFIDPRIDDPEAPQFQLGEALYAAKQTDRGHLTRYLDVAWGTKKEALKALADTFHFTNACLQLSGFNRTQARWQGIEQFLLERKAKKDKMRISVMTGPIFRQNDPKYQNEFMDAPVRIPLEFWKVCALIRDDGTLSATAFILSQDDITSLPGFEAFLDVTEVQTTIKHVEQRTGLKFPVLREHDHLAAGGALGTLELEGQTVIPLRTYEDIVV
jgi:endonuclease G